MANLIDLDLLSRFKTNADSTYLIKHLASGTLAAQTIEGDVNIGTDTNKRNLTVSGDLYVKGTEYIVDVETLNSSSDLIVINANNDALVSNTGLITLTGGTATYPQASPQPTSSTYKKNVYYKYSGGAYVLATSSFESGVTYYVKSSPAYALTAYDPIKDVIQLGSGTYKSTGEFTFGTSQAQAIATRESSIDDRSILIWDSGANQIRGSNTLISDLQPSSTILTSLAGVNTSSTGLLKITNGSVSIDSTGYITSSSDQTGLSGNKTTSGAWTFTHGDQNTIVVSNGDNRKLHIGASGPYATPSIKLADTNTISNTYTSVLSNAELDFYKYNSNNSHFVMVSLSLANVDVSSTDASYLLKLPAKAGTIATLSDIPAPPTNYITTNSNQTGLTGDKTTSGNWTFLSRSDWLDSSDGVKGVMIGSPSGAERILSYDFDTTKQTYTTEIKPGYVQLSQFSTNNDYNKSVKLKIQDTATINSNNSYTLTVPLKTGTLATTSDLPTNYVTTNTSQIINGVSKAWTDSAMSFYNTTYGVAHYIRIDATSTTSAPYIEANSIVSGNDNRVAMNYSGVKFTKKITPVSTQYAQTVTLQIDQSTFSSNADYTLTLPKRTDTIATLSDLALATNAQIDALFGISA